MLTVISTGMLMGLAGSLHCVGMCGPLSLGLPVHNASPSRRTIAMSLYHGGRILMYATIGLIFGLMGRRFYLAGMQQTMSIVTGALLVLAATQYFVMRQHWQPDFIKKFHSGLQQTMIRLLKGTGWANYFLFGALNGLLPCGMVYVAVAAAMTTNSVTMGMLLMTGFGLGTLPALFALALFGYLINIQVRNKLRKLSPYFVCAIGLVLILRGLNLGIPYISPAMESAPQAAIDCH